MGENCQILGSRQGSVNRSAVALVVGMVLAAAAVIFFFISQLAALAFLLAVLFSVFLLFAIGHFPFGKRNKGCSYDAGVLCQALGLLVAKVVMADGKASDPELSVTKARLRAMFRSKMAAGVLDSVYLNLVPSVNSADCASEVEILKDYYDYRHLFATTEMLYTIAVMQGGIVSAEWSLLERLAGLLGISPADAAYLADKYGVYRVEEKGTGVPTETSPYSVLGVTASADASEVRNAYLSLRKRYGPNKHDDVNLKNVLAEKLREVEWAFAELNR